MLILPLRKFSIRLCSRYEILVKLSLYISISIIHCLDFLSPYSPLISQVICGTDPYPQNFRAKKWKIKDKFFTKADFQFMMRNLPVPVEEEDIEAMFEFADKDKDGKINYRYRKVLKKCFIEPDGNRN